MDITYQPHGINNFHSSPPIRLRIPGQTLEGCYLISSSQEKRIRKHFCGIRDCGCPHGAVVEFGRDYFGLRPGDVEVTHA